MDLLDGYGYERTEQGVSPCFVYLFTGGWNATALNRFHFSIAAQNKHSSRTWNKDGQGHHASQG